MDKAKNVVHKLHKAKPHLDYIAALLTIPVLITAILINVTNLGKSKNVPNPSPAPRSTYGNTSIETVKATSVPIPTSSSNCTPGIGNVSIDYPQNNSIVSVNPVCISIAYASNNHCAVVWAYRINSGPWSNYSNDSVCLYNMPSGQITYDLQIKSLVNSDTQIAHTVFTYAPPSPTPTPIGVTPTPSLTPSTTLTPQPTKTQ